MPGMTSDISILTDIQITFADFQPGLCISPAAAGISGVFDPADDREIFCCLQ